jgi:hypothetical protein
MRNALIAALAPLALSAPAFAGDENPAALASQTRIERELTQLAALLRLDFPGIEQMSDWDKALTLRDALYDGVELAPTPEGYDYYSPVVSYMQAMHGDFGQLCGGYSQLYQFALESLGVQTRRVGMWAAIDQREGVLNGHVSVDVLIDGEWVAMDPTFNASLTNADGERLSWPEAREHYAQGLTVLRASDGMTIDPTIDFDTYDIPLSALTVYMTIAPGMPGEDAQSLGYDGVLTYADGSTFSYGPGFNYNLDRDLAEYIGAN